MIKGFLKERISFIKTNEHVKNAVDSLKRLIAREAMEIAAGLIVIKHSFVKKRKEKRINKPASYYLKGTPNYGRMSKLEKNRKLVE